MTLPEIPFGFRDEGINYKRQGQGLVVDFTWIGSSRLYPDSIAKWSGGTPLSDDEKITVPREVLQFVTREDARPTVVINCDAPSRKLWNMYVPRIPFLLQRSSTRRPRGNSRASVRCTFPHFVPGGNCPWMVSKSRMSKSSIPFCRGVRVDVTRPLQAQQFTNLSSEWSAANEDDKPDLIRPAKPTHRESGASSSRAACWSTASRACRALRRVHARVSPRLLV
jgi:hypothetical protein